MTRLHLPGAVSWLALLFLIPSTLLLPANASGQTQSIDSNRQQGRIMQALFQVEIQASQQGWTADRLRLAGDLWYEAGDIRQALPYWEAASSELAADTLLARRLADAYLRLQRWPDAVDQLALLVASDETDAWAHYYLGILRAAFNPQAAGQHLRVAAAVPAYRDVATPLLEVVTEEESNPLIGMPVGLALADAAQWSFAELAFQHAADVGPDYAEALAYAGLARDRQGKDGGAWIARAVSLDQQNPLVRFLQGLHLRETADFTDSLDAFVLAVALDPQNPAYYAELGTAYRLIGNMAAAERWLYTAVDVSNQDARFQQLLALFYADEGYNLNDGGLALLENLTGSMPDDLQVQAAYGWALYLAGDMDGALAQIDGILEHFPDHARSLYYKAKIWLETDQLAQAMPLFERVAQLESPFQVEARRIVQGTGG